MRPPRPYRRLAALAATLLLMPEMGTAQTRSQEADRLLSAATSHNGNDFAGFMQTIPCSPELERWVFALTRSRRAMRQLTEKYGESDPWHYRRATINCGGWDGN
ncbi:MAG: hypothetical protein AAGE18_16065 [Pseudomonadota bacterium]